MIEHDNEDPARGRELMHCLAFVTFPSTQSSAYLTFAIPSNKVDVDFRGLLQQSQA